MSELPYFSLGGINTYVNPADPSQDGAVIHAVNVDSFPYGAKTKRSGYVSFLNNPDGSQINSLFSFPKNSGTSQSLNRASGTQIYYSFQGTGNWLTTVNGVVSNGAHIGHAILDDTMVLGDGVGSTRHSTNGLVFVDTPLAPIAPFFAQYQNRIYAAGTTSTLFYSSANDGTNWSTSGTSDSSSFTVPGAGKLGQIFKAQDNLIATKNSGLLYKWDGNSLIDMSTNLGPVSPYSVASAEDYWFWTNLKGHFGYGGGKPQLLSNAVQRLFYNRDSTGANGTVLQTSPGETFRYNYFTTLGTVTDDFTKRTINNAVLKYDFQKNEYLTYQLAHNPTAMHSYTDLTNQDQLIFGDSTGQCYQFSGTALTDAGSIINAEIEFMFNFQAPQHQKKWNYIRGVFNPDCEVVVQAAFSDIYEASRLVYQKIEGPTKGLLEYKPPNARSKFMFLKVADSSPTSRFSLLGWAIDADVIIHI